MTRNFIQRFGYTFPAACFAIILFFLNASIDNSFYDPTSWSTILSVAMPFILIAVAVAPALLSGSGGIDLSVGPTAGLVNALIVAVFVPAGLDNPLSVLPLVILTGLLVGAINGVLITLVRVPPIIATLGTYLVVNGLTLLVLPVSGGMAPDWIGNLSGSLGWFPLPLLPLVLVAAIWIALRKSAYGRNLLATGGDKRTAFTSGVNVVAVRFVAYCFCGLLAAITGFAFTVGLGSGDPNVATPYTLIGVAGAVLGGVSLAGGKGGLLGAALGGTVLFLLQNLLSLAHVSAFYSQVAYGAVLLAGLAITRGTTLIKRPGFPQAL